MHLSICLSINESKHTAVSEPGLEIVGPCLQEPCVRSATCRVERDLCYFLRARSVQGYLAHKKPPTIRDRWPMRTEVLRPPRPLPRNANFRVQGSGFRVQGSGFRVQGSGFRVQGPGFRVQGSGSRVQGPGVRTRGVVLLVSREKWRDAGRSRANMANARKSRPDSGLGFQVKAHQICQLYGVRPSVEGNRVVLTVGYKKFKTRYQTVKARYKTVNARYKTVRAHTRLSGNLQRFPPRRRWTSSRGRWRGTA